MVSAFINDGYTESGFVAGKEGLYPSVSFEFRPMTQPEIGRYYDSIQGKTGEQCKTIAARTVCGKMVSWDLSEEPPTPEQFLKLRPGLYDRMFEIVFGWGASDERPTTGETKLVDLKEDAKN